MPFPAIKLFSLFAKQLSKPMAEYIKRKSKANYWLRTYICMPPAQCKLLVTETQRSVVITASHLCDIFSLCPWILSRLVVSKVVVFVCWFSGYHKFDIRLRMWASGVKSKKYKVKPLSEDMAIDVGADLIGETFLLSVAIGKLFLYL